MTLVIYPMAKARGLSLRRRIVRSPDSTRPVRHSSDTHQAARVAVSDC